MAAAVAEEEPLAIVLIGGGVRSGKSRYALSRARACGGTLTYIATAQPLDEEMSARIRRHRAERGTDFETIEEPIELARAIASRQSGAIVIDCITLWLSNISQAPGRRIDTEIEAVIAAAKQISAGVFIVTNEVGCGIVPVTALGREFRDQSGLINQRIADAADEVYFMVFGQPLRIK